MAKKAIVLVNGELHSTAALAVAASRNYEIYALTIDYGNKNTAKLETAKKWPLNTERLNTKLSRST